MRSLTKIRILACASCLTLLLSASGGPVQASQLTIQQLFAFACDSSGKVCPDGRQPNSLIQSADGNFYGTTASGGTGNQAAGTVFKITASGQLATLYTFVADQNGTYPRGASPDSLVEGDDGFLYGAASGGGTNNQGAIFKLSKTGTIQVLYSFCSQTDCPDGYRPSGLVLGNDGNVYGFTTFNAALQDSVLFRMTPSGAYTILHTFNAPVEGPHCLGIVLASDGNFYGTTIGGRALTTFFRLTPGGKFKVLHSTHYGQFPTSAPIQAASGRLYAALDLVNPKNYAPGLFESGPSGAGYQQIQLPYAAGDWVTDLIEASDENFWACIPLRLSAMGSIVSFTHGGKALREIAFDGTDGAIPEEVLQGSDGTMFGVTQSGGSVSQGETANGVVFTLDAGLPAPKPLFVTFNPSHGKAGSQVMIHGVRFVGAAAVTFNGVSATFKVLNTGNILATVPAGATTGPIAVRNAGGTTRSKQQFVVE